MSLFLEIEFAAASFVYGRYINDIGEISKLNWHGSQLKKEGILIC